jgi:hypothetical protein
MLDLHDKCCALHHLVAPLPQVASMVPVGFAGTRLYPAKVTALADGGPVLLYRPPRPLALI